ncbi:hypothetical protein ILUMI_22473 [Ignelater luminosus]|uniref:Uncharacterized protein n=1 Tax=Ignelater luminosus TaxID=2038154 RepID=A0A8K0CH31_IGNLU|nr:hypothetical protein ILUMI_22473 [Ignelater luminosus]
MIRNMFQKAMNGKKPPNEWTRAYSTSIFKRGDRKKAENYRGISVLSTLGRIYSRVVRNKLEEAIEGKIGEDQSCIDHIYTVEQLLEKKRAKKQRYTLSGH